MTRTLLLSSKMPSDPARGGAPHTIDELSAVIRAIPGLSLCRKYLVGGGAVPADGNRSVAVPPGGTGRWLLHTGEATAEEREEPVTGEAVEDTGVSELRGPQ